MKAIITYYPEYRVQAKKEIAVFDGKAVRKFDDLTSLIESPQSVAEATDKLLASKPIFIRHMFPVLAEGVCSKEKEAACSTILEAIAPHCDITPGDGFAVQCRALHLDVNDEWGAKDVEVHVGKHFDTLGCVPVFADNRIMNEDIAIISVLIFGEYFYAGFSRASQNLSSHSDEHRLLSRSSREISRAEKKLKEAINAFKIQVTGTGNALDMGASPGGWTKVLADYGFHVSAVDPGDLHPSLHDHPNIKHYKSRIESVQFEIPFEIVVNDMNIDPQDTARIMNDLAPRLVDGGLAVVTLKLPFYDVERAIGESLDILATYYEILNLRHLAHNRREVTALLRKKSNYN